MNDFFSVIIIIAVSVSIFVTYYAGKNLYFRYKNKRIKSEIVKKQYDDEKRYIQFYIRTLLQELRSGQIQWIQIFSRLYPEAKIELIFNSIYKLIQLQHRLKSISDEDLSYLEDLGIKSWEMKNGLHCFYVSHNAKIVTDVVYFILEKVNQQKRIQNIKIVTSGGQD